MKKIYKEIFQNIRGYTNVKPKCIEIIKVSKCLLQLMVTEYLRNHKYTLPLTHAHTHLTLDTLSGFSVNGSAQEYRAYNKREREGRREEEFNSNFKDYT